jgi:hypothetical protein
VPSNYAGKCYTSKSITSINSRWSKVTKFYSLIKPFAFSLSHRSPAVRKTSAKYIYIVCEKLGPNKILSGTRDITERVLQVAATFASDGPPEIRYVNIHKENKTIC